MTLYALTLVLAILQVMDWYTTTKILAKGGRELNPVMRWAFDTFGQQEALIGKGVGVTLLGYIAGTENIWLLVALVTWYVAVVIHNWRNMRG